MKLASADVVRRDVTSSPQVRFTYVTLFVRICSPKCFRVRLLKTFCFKIWTSASEVIDSNFLLSAFSNLIQLRGCVCSSFICSSSGPGQTVMASFNTDVHADKVKSASTPIWTIATNIRLPSFRIYKFKDIVWSKWAVHTKISIFHIFFFTWKTFIKIFIGLCSRQKRELYIVLLTEHSCV